MVSAWGEARATLDVDLAVWVEPAAVDATVAALCRRFQPLPKNPVEFVRATHVLPLTTPQSVRAELPRRFGNKIDRGYLEPRLADLAESLARPEIRLMMDEA
jgi:hypothetical protein